MKKAIFTLLLALYGVMLSAQVPQKLGYQILVLDPKTGTVLKTQDVNVELQIRQGSADGTVVYTYKNTEHTNQAGICNIVLDTPDTIDWSNGPFFLATFVNDKMLSCTQFLTVPFAFHADKATTVNSWPTDAQLVGTWKRVNSSSEIIYTFTFKSDKTVTLSIVDHSASITHSGTWGLLAGNFLHLRFADYYDDSNDKYDLVADFVSIPCVINGVLYIDEFSDGDDLGGAYVKQ
jgi:hypothetical protein